MTGRPSKYFSSIVSVGFAPSVVDAEVGDVAFVLQHLDHARSSASTTTSTRPVLPRGLRVADAGQQIGNGISHAHAICSLPARLGRRPAISPRAAASRIFTRARPNLRYTPRERPVIAQRLRRASGLASRGSFCSFDLRVGTLLGGGLRAANQLFQLSALRRVLLHDLGATLLALDHVRLGHSPVVPLLAEREIEGFEQRLGRACRPSPSW